MNPNSGKVRYNAFTVQLDVNTSDPGIVIAHEGGHVRDIASRPVYAWEHRAECSSVNCRAPEEQDNEFVKPAIDAENRFVRLRNKLNKN